jgi:hypothetical protein
MRQCSVYHPFTAVAGVMKRLFGIIENIKHTFHRPARLQSTRLRMCCRQATSAPVIQIKKSIKVDVAVIIIIIITPWPFALSPLHSPT